MTKVSDIFPVCPNNLPEELINQVRGLADAWANSSIRPSPTPHIIQEWETLIQEWIDTPDLPLFARKHKGNRGSEIIHLSGRILIPVDNSPAHWSLSQALLNKTTSIDDIRIALENDQIPVAMAFTKEEKVKAKYRFTRGSSKNINQYGWKVAHIEPVELPFREPLREAPINLLTNHFKRLMSPSNMFLIPLPWSGLAEVPEVAEAIKTYMNKSEA